MADVPDLERRLVARCIMPSCGAHLVCPPNVDPWVWAATEDVRAFKIEHAACGNERTVGLMFEMVEKQNE